ncbi:MAG: hypothetical protein EVA76_04880 [Candidatus Pelagibacterales bacterium]|nr:MAG: hypothetical protein EVA76_04880 [Pelagibacterales bacterium]
MIIQCQSCSRKFIVKDSDISSKGRTVKCGYCSVTWHQMPISNKVKVKAEKKETIKKSNEGLSVDEIKASDGKTYKFLGTQWAQLLPSGKTGLFAKKKIGKELDKLTGRERVTEKREKKIKKELNPSSENLNTDKKLPDVYRPKEGLGFFGYIFLIIIIGFSIVGILKTFENDLLNYYPESKYIFELLNMQLEFFSETLKNMIVIINDLINSY